MTSKSLSISATDLTLRFDALIMLTWSDWATEPRSNRHHFALRFAQLFPVYFVQPDAIDRKVVATPAEELSDHGVGQPKHAITLVHILDDYGPEQAQRLGKFLASRGVKRPLVWVYNPLFEHSIALLNAPLTIFHATEDYFARPEKWQVGDPKVQAPLRRVLQRTDLLVGVSEAVTRSYHQNGGYQGQSLTLPNGCDAGFWLASTAGEPLPTPTVSKIALYQGGINARLDYDLLTQLIAQRPDWQFWFCGKIARDSGRWSEIAGKPNVKSFGNLPPGGVAALARDASVGLIPFHQDETIRGSLPLKAYEYIACGLPVVSVPIGALERDPDLFSLQETVEGFSEALDRMAIGRSDPVLRKRMTEVATANGYDARFATLCHVIKSIESRSASTVRLNVLLIYDDGSTHVGAIAEHIGALRQHLGHDVYLLPGTGPIGEVATRHGPIDLSLFDAVIIHFSVRISLENHMNSSIAEAITRFVGPKLIFVQDEYENTDTALGWIQKLGIDAVYTNVPGDQVSRIYQASRFPHVDIFNTLTGYVKEDSELERFALPLSERRIMVGYRGRRLGHHYGQLGDDKRRIGEVMAEHMARRGLPFDIEVDDDKRIYGEDWYRFLGQCRATLGTESGANVFDRDGSLRRLAAKHANLPFATFSRQFLTGREGEIRMNQVSPKIFEAIRLKTALILFEGSYSGVVEAGLHYIPLRHDFSNVDRVLDQLCDDMVVSAMTERAYRDVIQSGRFSYRRFAGEIGAYLSGRLGQRPRAQQVFSAEPATGLHGVPDAFQPLLAQGVSRELLVGLDVSRDAYLRALAGYENGKPVRTGRTSSRVVLWLLEQTKPLIRRAARSAVNPANEQRLPVRLMRALWHKLPARYRFAILARFR